MKTTFVSTASISQSLRYQLLRMQSDLVKAQSESSSGKVADTGLALGTRTSQSVAFNRDIERLDGIVSQNGLVSSRLSATQNSLTQLVDKAQSLMSTLTASVSGDAPSSVTMNDAKGTLEAMTSILNTTLNGEHIFAGVNTDVKPIGDYTAGSPAKAAFDAGFSSYFGFTQNDPAAANITAAQMNDFFDTVVQPQFMGAGWQANWSDATDDLIQSRISLNETMDTSVSANNDGIRRLAMVSATVADLFSSSTLSSAAKSALAEKSVGVIGSAISDLGQLQSKTGLIEQQVTKASDRMKTQSDLLEKTVSGLEGVDPYEAATRVTNLLTQIEASYQLTARLQQMSLVKFL